MITLTPRPTSIFGDEVAAAAHVAKTHRSDGGRDGIAALAEAMGKSYHVLANKLNPNQEGHFLTVLEKRAIEQLADPAGLIVRTHARMCGGMFVRLPTPQAGAEDELLDDLLEVHRHFGEVAQATHEARADGVIERREYEAIRAAGTQLQEAIETFLRDLEQSVREKPLPRRVA